MCEDTAEAYRRRKSGVYLVRGYKVELVMKIILASQSPRRRELLSRAGFEFEIVTSEKDEVTTKTLPAEVVIELSCRKAYDVYDKVINEREKNLSEEILVIGADTVVSIDGMIFGKPKDDEDAFDMLSKLQGRTHEVYTGVTFVFNEKGEVRTHSFCECTKVTFFSMTDEEIRDYIKTKEPADKAGAYGIQGLCAVFIKGIEGDYNNVVGLPIARVYQEIKALKIILE